MDDNTYWLCLWLLVIVGSIAIGSTVSGCVEHRQTETRILIQSGISPMAAKCAIEGEILREAPCILLIQPQK